jgi:hypothetical protein
LYRVCLIDKKGRVIVKDALVTEGDHGLFERIAKAAKKPVLRPRPNPPRTKSEFVIGA